MGSAFSPITWATFFSAQIGASAGLTGLIFVAVSINLKQIVAMRLLVARSAKALFTLVGVLLMSTLLLAPGQSVRVLGGELLGLGLLLWLTITWAQRVTVRGNTYVSRGQRIFYFILTQLSLLPYVVGGLSLFLGRGGGLHWVVAAICLSYLAALLDAWVLLIEIQR